MTQGAAQGSLQNAVVCPKCQSEMREGFLLDFGDNFTAWATSWIEGKPETSFWSGVKRAGRSRIPVAAYRCTSCGYVEIYAR
jgi:rubredoxin